MYLSCTRPRLADRLPAWLYPPCAVRCHARSLHAYEFVELLLRCSARYCTEKHLKRSGGRKLKHKARDRAQRASTGHTISGHILHARMAKEREKDARRKAKQGHDLEGGDGGLPLSECLHTLLADHVLRRSCSHASMTEGDWVFCSPTLHSLATEFRVPLERLFRYYSVDKPATIVSSGDSRDGSGGAQQFWKVRSLELLDDTMDFNELYCWLSRFELLDATFTPKDAARLFTRVTGSDEIVAQVHKNNRDSEMVLDEFLEFLFSMALAHTKPAPSLEQRAHKLSKAMRVRGFLMKRVLSKAAEEMPIESKALVKAVGARLGAGEGYDGIDSEEEELTGQALEAVQLLGVAAADDDGGVSIPS